MVMADLQVPGYCLTVGSETDRPLLAMFMQQTYQELYPDQDFSHLTLVDHYFSESTPLWWVKVGDFTASATQDKFFGLRTTTHPVACLWLGNAVDQVRGDRHAHVFLLYVLPEHRRRGIGSALMRHAESWARERGDRQLSLQVFQIDQPALQLYNKLGYEPWSIWMTKPLGS